MHIATGAQGLGLFAVRGAEHYIAKKQRQVPDADTGPGGLVAHGVISDLRHRPISLTTAEDVCTSDGLRLPRSDLAFPVPGPDG